MPRRAYDWKNGPDLIQQHSIAKHRILQSYLAEYFKTLVSSPNQELLSVTLVDGFAGGGLYIHSETKELVKGSPFIFLDATREAEFTINRDRHKPIKMNVDYFFIEPEKHAYQHLRKTLEREGYGSKIGHEIQIFNSKFQDNVDSIIDFIRKKNPRNGRSIFSLDQYGYKEVPTALIRKILQNLPSAEIILTFAVDSFLNYAGDSRLTNTLLGEIGVPDLLRGKTLEQIKESEKDWRFFIQSSLYKELVLSCGAKHYTPFFVRNAKGHGDYWLIHLSQHHRARDVMTEVHWANNNYFIHYGGAGLDMFQMIGYDPDHDFSRHGQVGLGFEFDDVAKSRSILALSEQIPAKVYAHDAGLSFGELFATTCNDSPASADIYRETLQGLIERKVVEVTSVDNVSRRSARQIKATDQILPPSQRSLFII